MSSITKRIEQAVSFGWAVTSDLETKERLKRIAQEVEAEVREIQADDYQRQQQREIDRDIKIYGR